MTSKQALEDIIDEIKYTHNDGKTLTPFDQKRIDSIAKDLEVLAVLKKYVNIRNFSKKEDPTQDSLVILTGGQIEIFEDYKKIKEWLEK